ncbi:MAG TPA: hypothetical protein VGU45_05050 [Microvirga sp.]|nr:hypothetical protein [Microvirga sp.]
MAPVTQTPALPAAIPFYKSPVMIGGIISLLFKTLSVAFPGRVPELDQSQTDIAANGVLLLISGFGDLLVLWGRIFKGTAQPVTLTQGAADQVRRVLSLAVVILLIPLLAACQTVATTTPGAVGKVITPTPQVVTETGGLEPTLVEPTAADLAIARVSPQVASYCSYIRLALQTGQFFVNNANHQRVVRQARQAVETFCAAPPSDVATALTTLAAIYINVRTVRVEYTKATQAAVR